MYQTIEGFLKTWKYEQAVTQRVLDSLTDESLKQEVTPQDRTLARIAWHIVTAIPVIISFTGTTLHSPNDAPIPNGQTPVPTSAQEIADAYRQMNESFIYTLTSQWTDITLKDKHDVFGQNLSKSLLLLTIINHQIHHRGQATILMRQAGLTVPGIYGPAREEWAAIGMDIPKL